MLIQIQHEYCTMIGYDAMNHGNSIHGRIKMQRQKFKLDHDFVGLETFCRIMMSSNNEEVFKKNNTLALMCSKIWKITFISSMAIKNKIFAFLNKFGAYLHFRTF